MPTVETSAPEDAVVAVVAETVMIAKTIGVMTATTTGAADVAVGIVMIAETTAVMTETKVAVVDADAVAGIVTIAVMTVDAMRSAMIVVMTVAATIVMKAVTRVVDVAADAVIGTTVETIGVTIGVMIAVVTTATKVVDADETGTVSATARRAKSVASACTLSSLSTCRISIRKRSNSTA